MLERWLLTTAIFYSTRCTATSRHWPKLRRRELRQPAVLPTFSSKLIPPPGWMSYSLSIYSRADTNEFRIAETLPEEVLAKMHAPAKSAYPVIEPQELTSYDAILFGVPTRYGNFPAQWKAFWDKTGGIWAKGGFHGKYVGAFVSTGTPGGGQESTVIACMSTFVHHGMIFVPLGYKNTFPILANLSEVRGGSPWGAGTFAVSYPFWTRRSPILHHCMASNIHQLLRVPMVPVSPVLLSSSSPSHKANAFMRLSQRSSLCKRFLII